MVSGIFLGYEMKHLITGESISPDRLRKIEIIISSNKNVSTLLNIKVIPIGSKQYLALVMLDYKDFLEDKEIVEINNIIKNKINEIESTISEIYFNPQ